MSAREQPSTRNINRSATGLPVHYIGAPLQGAIDAGTKRDKQTQRDAFMLLDNWNDYHVSAKRLVEELRFNFGYDADEAHAVYKEWLKVQ